jgi:hypothetical protein
MTTKSYDGSRALKPARRQPILEGCLLATTLAALHLGAQTTLSSPPAGGTAQTDEDIVTLSPFEVRAEDDTGYVANSTLAGTRLRTDLRDVAASVSVVTKDFMSDIGSNDLSTLLNYTLGTEINGLAGNMSGASTDGQGFTDFDNNTGLREIQPRARVRSLDIADQARDYFITSVPTDGYNTERYDISRGANAILFGLGSPAGIINTGIIRATTARNKGIFEAQVDDYGSYRGTIDYNAVVIQDRLAVRLAGLTSEMKFRQDPAYVRDDRYTITFTAKPWKGGTLRGTYESADQKSNRPQNRAPFDYITWWDAVGRPVTNAGTGVVTMTATPANAYAAAVGAGGENGAVITRWGYGSGVNLIMTDPTSSEIGMNFNVAGSTTAFAQGTLNSPRLNWNQTVRRLGGGWPTYSSSVMARINQSNANSALDPYFNFWKDPTLSDPRIFDFYNNLIEGPNKQEWGFWDVMNVAFEQRFGRDAGIEVAYDKQSLDTGYINPWNWRDGYALFVDINSHLPNGQANPNFARPYINNNSWQRSDTDEREAFRATAYYELDLAKRIDGRLGDILGRHVLTGVYTDQNHTNENFSGRPYVLGMDYVQAAAAAGITPGWQTFDLSGGADYRMVQRTAYLGDAIGSSPIGAGIRGIKAPFDIFNDGEVSTLWYDSALNGGAGGYTTRSFSVINGDRWDKRRTATYLTGGSDESDIQSTAVVLNSYWLDRNLVTNLGWRRDEFDFHRGNLGSDPATGLARTDPADVRVDPTPTLSGTESNFSYGIVAHLPESWAKKLPWGTNVSLTYNKSDNFQPAAQRYTIFDQPLASPTGETKDMGVLVSTLDGKIEFRVIKFESTVQSSGSQSGAMREMINDLSRFPRGQLSAIAGPEYLTTPGNGATQAGINAFDQWLDSSPEGQVLNSTFGYQYGTSTSGRRIITAFDSRLNEVVGVTDTRSEGYEFELIYNPNANWRMALNAAKQDVVLSNIAPELAEFISDVRSGLQSSPAGTLPTSANGGQTISQWADTLMANFSHVLLKEGQSNPEVREWRVNFVTNYAFREGLFKGFSLGGAVRWQDEVAIGYDIATVTGADGQPFYIEDINRPYYGPSETNFDAWVGYERRILDDKVKMRLKLNIRNLGTGNELIPVVAQPDGSIAASRIADPQRVTLTSTFEF